MVKLNVVDVKRNITELSRWIDPTDLMHVIEANPSLRGFAYGYVSERELTKHVVKLLGLSEDDYTKDDDHSKTKADLAFSYRSRRYTIQVKSIQTESLRQVSEGVISATVQNDASDRRKVTLPNGDILDTTCYIVGEYDILAVSLQPFTGKWEFVYKKNKDLGRSRYRNYTAAQREHLLATSEKLYYPLRSQEGWTTDLFSILEDRDLGKATTLESSPSGDTVLVEEPGTHEEVIIQERREP